MSEVASKIPATIEPTDAKELAAVLADANAQGQAVIPTGGGTKAEWGNSATRADVAISTGKLNRVVDHAAGDMTVVVEAGCTIGDLQRTLAQQGQRLSCDALWPDHATVGGILATNDSGAWRLRYGGLRDLVIGVTLALADGTLAESGGRVVKNVAGYDLPKLATGSLGTLGIITRAVFRLHPLPHASRTLTMRFASIDAAQKAILAIQNSQLAHTALQLRLQAGGEPELDILFEGTEAGIAAQQAQVQTLIGADLAEASQETWQAREQLWPASEGAAIAKVSVLPSRIAWLTQQIGKAAKEWMMLAHATGLVTVHMQGDWSKLRNTVEADGGSLVLLTPVAGMDAWGSAGDALGLMRALKAQFDPKGTLNPGRFVGGI